MSSKLSPSLWALGLGQSEDDPEAADSAARRGSAYGETLDGVDEVIDVVDDQEPQLGGQRGLVDDLDGVAGPADRGWWVLDGVLSSFSTACALAPMARALSM